MLLACPFFDVSTSQTRPLRISIRRQRVLKEHAGNDFTLIQPSLCRSTWSVPLAQLQQQLSLLSGAGIRRGTEKSRRETEWWVLQPGCFCTLHMVTFGSMVLAKSLAGYSSPQERQLCRLESYQRATSPSASLASRWSKSWACPWWCAPGSRRAFAKP